MKGLGSDSPTAGRRASVSGGDPFSSMFGDKPKFEVKDPFAKNKPSYDTDTVG